MSEDITNNESLDEGWNQFSNFAIALKSRLKSIVNFEDNVFIDDFKQLKDNKSRIEICLKHQNIRKGVQQLYEDIFKSNVNNNYEKSLIKCKELRQKAANCFREGLFTDSLKLYSEAICLAPIPSTNTSPEESVELSLAFNDRSEVLFRVEDFESCFEDIEEAIRNNLPKDMRHKILLRKANCLTFLANNDLALKVIEELRQYVKECDKSIAEEVETELEKLLIQLNLQKEETNEENCDINDENNDSKENISNPNPLISNASNSIKIGFSSTKGRFVSAVEDIKFGDTLIVEQPFVTYLYSDNFESYCNHCLTVLDNHSIPCLGCSQIRYCCHSCREKAWNEYHSSECNSLLFLSKEIGISYIVLRLLFKTGIKEVIKISEELSNEKPFRSDVVYSSDYRSIYQLLDHQNEHNLDSMMSYTLTAVFLLLVLENKSHISPKDQSYVRLGEVILKHIQQLSTNLISILEQNFDEDFNKFGFDGSEDIIGTAVYPTISLLNHSCDPNILTFFNGSEMTVKSSRNIKSGEEINYCYGPNFQRMSRKDRQNKLKTQYFFDCQCFVCENRKENLTRALLCHQCNGPVIYNEDYSSQCLNCKSIGLDVRKCIENVEKGLKYSAEGLDLLEKQKLTEALVNLNKSDELLTLNLYIQNRLLCKSKDDLCRCYAMMNHFDRAVRYCQQSVRITGLIFGEQSTEILIELMKMISLKWEVVDETEDQNNKKQLANELLEVIKRADNIVSKLQTTEGFQNAFQSELNFLNEKRLSILSLV